MKKLLLLFCLIISIPETIFAQDWEKIYEEKEGLRLVLKDGKYGYINSSDKVVIKPQFKDAYNFNTDGYATIKIDGKKGKINKNGEIIIPTEYEKIFLLKEGFFTIKKDGKYGYCNNLGKLVIKPQFDVAYDFGNNGYASVKLNSKFGLIDKTGKIIIPIEYDKVYKFSNSLALVKKDNKYGYVDKKGKIVIPIIYDDAFDFKNSYAKIIKDGKTGKVNLAGQITWNIQIGDIINNGIVFYVDKSGKHGLICSNKDLGRLDQLRAGLAARKHEGYNSWRLPTLEEAKLMLNQAEAIRITNKGYNVLSGHYWTSTEAQRGEYYLINKGSSGTGFNVKTSANVRAVKEF